MTLHMICIALINMFRYGFNEFCKNYASEKMVAKTEGSLLQASDINVTVLFGSI